MNPCCEPHNVNRKWNNSLKSLNLVTSKISIICVQYGNTAWAFKIKVRTRVLWSVLTPHTLNVKVSTKTTHNFPTEGGFCLYTLYFHLCMQSLATTMFSKARTQNLSSLVKKLLALLVFIHTLLWMPWKHTLFTQNRLCNILFVVLFEAMHAVFHLNFAACIVHQHWKPVHS